MPLVEEPPILIGELPFRALEKGCNRKAYLYSYCLPWAEVVYDYRLGRGREGPLEFLKSFRGKLQTDGYDG